MDEKVKCIIFFEWGIYLNFPCLHWMQFLWDPMPAKYKPTTFAGTGVDLSLLFRVVHILYATETLFDNDLESCLFRSLGSSFMHYIFQLLFLVVEAQMHCFQLK